MITLAMMKPIGGLLKRLDIKALAEKVKLIDVSKLMALPPEDAENYQEAKTEREAETAKLGEILIMELAMRLEDVSDDLVRLCAAYKGISEDEAMKLDVFTTIKELFAEEGIGDFFKSAVSTAMKK